MPRRNVPLLRRHQTFATGESTPLPAGYIYLASNTLIWLTAGVGVTTSGSKVSYLANQGSSGSAQDVQQTTDADRPDYNASDADFNDCPTITFDENVQESLVQVGTLPAAPSAAEIFLVAKANSDPSQFGEGAPFHLSNTNRPQQVNFSNGIIYTTFMQGAQLATVDPTDDLSQPFLYNEHITSGVSGVHTVNLNGSQIWTRTANITTAWSDPFELGHGLHPSADRYWDGKIAELAVIPSVASAGDRADVVAYLTAKYDL